VFGAEYDDYCKHVSSFFPRLTMYKNDKVKQPPYNPKAGLKSEKRTLQAFFGISIVIVIIWIIKNL